MVVIHVAYTRAVNAPGVEPVLTQAQTRARLQQKVERPQDFISAFDDSTVLERKDNVITREISFAAGQVPGNAGKQ